jgi:hypothetical protein
LIFTANASLCKFPTASLASLVAREETLATGLRNVDATKPLRERKTALQVYGTNNKTAQPEAKSRPMSGITIRSGMTQRNDIG